MSRSTEIAAIARQFKQLAPDLDERGLRRLAASESLRQGWGGITLLSEITGMARSTIMAGRRELAEEDAAERAGTPREPGRRVRRRGGGRKPITQTQPGIVEALSGWSSRMSMATRSAR